jgi:hypothetical protein
MEENFIFKEIDDLKSRIEQKEIQRNEIKNEVDNKLKERESLEKVIFELEEKKKHKQMKLEKIKSIISGDEYVISDFDIKLEDVLNYIPSNPREGLLEVEKGLEELRDVLNYENSKKKLVKIK